MSCLWSQGRHPAGDAGSCIGEAGSGKDCNGQATLLFPGFYVAAMNFGPAVATVVTYSSGGVAQGAIDSTAVLGEALTSFRSPNCC